MFCNITEAKQSKAVSPAKKTRIQRKRKNKELLEPSQPNYGTKKERFTSEIWKAYYLDENDNNFAKCAECNKRIKRGFHRSTSYMIYHFKTKHKDLKYHKYKKNQKPEVMSQSSKSQSPVQATNATIEVSEPSKKIFEEAPEVPNRLWLVELVNLDGTANDLEETEDGDWEFGDSWKLRIDDSLDPEVNDESIKGHRVTEDVSMGIREKDAKSPLAVVEETNGMLWESQDDLVKKSVGEIDFAAEKNPGTTGL